MAPNKKIPWWFTEVGEIEKRLVIDAFDKKKFSMGSVTRDFENQMAEKLGVRYAVACPSGTASLTMALMAAGMQPGDEVIVPALTWIATANAAAVLGAKVVLADCLPDSPLINTAEVKKKITKKTKAIIPVHLNGRACAVDELKEMARGKNIVIIEDACKAMYCRTPQGYLGTLGDIGCFSLGMVSLISAGYGGMVITNRQDIFEKLVVIRNQGVPAQGDEKYLMLSFNFKFSDLLASIGLGQLSRLQEKIEHLDKVYRAYTEGLAGLSYLKVIPVDVESGKISLCYEVRSSQRENIIKYLEENNVEPLRFHLPLQQAPYLKNSGAFPNAGKFAEEGFILPCGPSQPLENVKRCVELLQNWGKRQG
jgi:perosamine synthetase